MFGLKNKSKSLNKLAELFEDEFVGNVVREGVAQEIISSCNDHVKKYGMRKMSLSELKKIILAQC